MKFPGGGDETQCGAGSTMAATANVRAWLPGALKRLGVDLLIDAPCGDRNWIRHVDLPCRYWGIEIDPDHVFAARDVGVEVRQNDLRLPWLSPLPSQWQGRTAFLSRDFFQHLDDEDGLKVLNNFRASGAKYLIATDHGVVENGKLEHKDGYPFRLISMTAPPFNLPPPIDQCDDGKHGRILGVYRL